MESETQQPLTVADAGSKGGKSTLAKYGKEFFREIGRKGQAALSENVTSEQRKAWGAKGGRPKRVRLSDKGEELNSK
jgi:general stress protein YciG